ncbi:MAG: glycosyltransferase family 2 protein [Clostridia bacterium]|nr:glycosyltransferase family 2 protein [Clostridia bacterium]
MGLNEPLLSIIVPVYNVEEFIEECIHSLLHQTYQNTEIILVDDGSTDNSGKICDTIASDNKSVTVYHKLNGGLSSARNYGIERANGAYLGFVDSDDFVDTQMYEILMHELLSSGADAAVCDYYNYYNSEQYSVRQMPEKETTVFEGESAKLRVYHEFSACNKVYKRELFAQVRYPEGKLYEDARTMYKIADKVEKLVIVPKPLYYYRQRQTSIMGTFSTDNFLDRVSVWDEIYDFEKDKFPESELTRIKNRKNALIIELLKSIYQHRNEKIDKGLVCALLAQLSEPVEATKKEKVFLSFFQVYSKFGGRNSK